MNWTHQLYLAFQLLNNAALLAIGVLGVCHLRERVTHRLSPRNQSMLVGGLLAVLGLVSMQAPLAVPGGPQLSLTIALFPAAALYFGIVAGVVTCGLVGIYSIAAGAQVATGVDPRFFSVPEAAAFVPVVAGWFLLKRAGIKPSPRHVVLLALVSTASALATFGVIVGWPIFIGIFKAVVPAWLFMTPATMVALAAIVRHYERSKARDAALAEGERRFRNFYNNTPVMLTAVNEKDRIVAVSNHWLKVTGYSRDEVIGRSRYDFLAPSSGSDVRDQVLPALRGSHLPVEQDLQIVRKDGTLIDVAVTCVAIKDPVTGGEQVLSYSIDQTARKRAERNLGERESELRAIIDHAPVAIFLKDREGRYRLVTRQFECWTGRTAAEILGLTDAEIVPPELARQIRESDREVLEHGRVHQSERRPSKPQHPEEHILVTKVPIRDETGGIIGIAGFAIDTTERRRAEAALRETQGRLQAIMDNAPFAIFLKDREGRYQLINRTYTDWFGDRQEDLYGRTTVEVYPGKLVESAGPADRRVLEHGQVAVVDWTTETAKPGIEQVQITKFPIRDDNGTIVGMAGFISDITDRKRAMAALSESRELLIESQQLGKMGYIFVDRVNRRAYWSDSMFELRAEPKREFFTLEEAKAFVHPEDRSKYETARDAAIAERRDFEIDWRVFRRDGSTGWERSVGHPRFDEAGNLTSLLLLVQDITDRKRSEELALETEQRFRALIENSNDMVTVVATDGRVTYRSPSSTEQMGMTAEEVIGRPIFDRVHPDDVADLKVALKSIGAAPGHRENGRSRVRHKDGTWRHLAWTARNAADIPGVDGIIINSRDVTEAQRLEERLLHAQKMEAVGQLAGGVAHDFNNLLGAILGFSGFLLQDLREGSPEHGFAERIAMAGERGKELVQQILAFSRRDSLERKPTDIARVVRETRELLRASLPSSTRLDVKGETEGLVSNVNAGQISQVLLNLCLNANDALGGESGTVSIETSHTKPGDPGYDLLEGADAGSVTAEMKAGSRVVAGALQSDRSYVRITVADTGSGMSEDVLKRIFDPFFTTKERGTGTGLGLAVVHGIVMACEGACVVTSQPGAGSIFCIYFPLTAVSGLPEVPEVTEPSPRGNERLLVIDDEISMTEMLHIGLGRLGYRVVALNDPVAALKVFSANPNAWDAVISDQVMPSMKGLTLFRRMKAIRPSLRFILCTGFSDGATEESAHTAGVDVFLLKPAPPQQLAAAIRRMIDDPAGEAREPPRQSRV